MPGALTGGVRGGPPAGRLWRFFLIICALTTTCRATAAPPQAPVSADCLSCHRGIEAMGDHHPGRCIDCHLAPVDRARRSISHQDIVRNPSDFECVDEFCGDCHKAEIRRLRRSLHGTQAGIVNQTRYLWGAQASAVPARFGLGGVLTEIPDVRPGDNVDRVSQLVDDFLRRRCLCCHLQGEGMAVPGRRRASGCAACHVLYAEDGRYRGRDRAVSPSATGYPKRHRFTTRIPTAQCTRCHCGNRVGGDYQGRFERDYALDFRPPSIEQRAMERERVAHRLSRDVHAQKGLWCTDCHSGAEVMGTGRCDAFALERSQIGCEDCHGGVEAGPRTGTRGVSTCGELFFFDGPASGTRHQLSRFSPKTVAHGVPAHERLRCSACHAQWSFQDYGLSVIREDTVVGQKWLRLFFQGDPELAARLRARIGSNVDAPIQSRDRVSGEMRPGIWSVGWRFRRWEWMPLGVDHENRIAVLRPLYQYRISYGDPLGRVPIDNAVPETMDQRVGWAFMPYVPHTTGPRGRNCVACHQNPVAAGLGFGGSEEQTPDTRLIVPSPPIRGTGRLLVPAEQKRLMEPGAGWGALRLRAITGKALKFESSTWNCKEEMN